MKNDNNSVDLDDFWVELINKSEWSKNQALRTPGEFKNLNILGSKKKISPPVSIETKVVEPQAVIFKSPKKSTLLVIVKIILVIAIICLLITALLVTYNLFGGHFNIWNFRYG